MKSTVELKRNKQGKIFMCIVCNITQNEFIETALAVENVFDGEYMTIPLMTTPEQIHSFEVIQSMLLNANLIALIF